MSGKVGGLDVLLPVKISDVLGCLPSDNLNLFPYFHEYLDWILK
jgi:hypothetical protein